jgi:ADP-heptose:LPS heptosyltransferase
MRKVDYWVGVPLCALSTLLLRLLARFKRRTPRPRNVLLIELSEMGSAILVDPAMEELKARGATLHFAIFAQNKPSLDLLGTVPDENIFRLHADTLGALLKDSARFLAWTRRKQIDTVIDLELFSRATALLSGWSGAGRVVGFHRFHNEGLFRGEMLTRRVMYNPHVHIARNFFSLVEAAYSEPGDDPPARLRTPDERLTLKRAAVSQDSLLRVADLLAREAGWNGRQPIVLINANASDLLPQRRWPRERFADLARRLLAYRGDALLLLTGSPAEWGGLEKLARQINDPRCVNFAGRVGFSDLVALYHLSLVMVTNDSGPAHFAAVTRMPTVVLFGPETPALYGSLGESEPIFAGLNCSPCVTAWNHRNTPCTDNRCLQAIDVDRVFAATHPHLDRVAVGRSLPEPS